MPRYLIAVRFNKEVEAEDQYDAIREMTIPLHALDAQFINVSSNLLKPKPPMTIEPGQEMPKKERGDIARPDAQDAVTAA